MQYFIAIRELVPHSIWTFATSTGMLIIVVHPSVSAAAISRLVFRHLRVGLNGCLVFLILRQINPDEPNTIFDF